MITLGFRGGRAFPNNGIILNIRGTIRFKGRCQIGNNSSIIVGENSECIFDDRFLAPCSLKIFCYCGIEFGKRTIFGWDSIIQDTDFHPIYDKEMKKFRKGYGRIHIGNDNWFSQNCLVMHSVNTPERCIFSARSIVTRNNKFESYCIHGGQPLRVLSRNVMLDYEHYMIKDYSENRSAK